MYIPTILIKYDLFIWAGDSERVVDFFKYFIYFLEYFKGLVERLHRVLLDFNNQLVNR
jgi:hypothetical protein